jgi:hypothetical protein
LLSYFFVLSYPEPARQNEGSFPVLLKLLNRWLLCAKDLRPYGKQNSLAGLKSSS